LSGMFIPSKRDKAKRQAKRRPRSDDANAQRRRSAAPFPSDPRQAGRRRF
jgi:hypothetical protein